MGDATMNYSSTPQYQYKFSGKVIQQELGLMNYDLGARHYDPRIARWTGIDVLAENYHDMSPNSYVLKSPINNYDPNGMEIGCPNFSQGAWLGAFGGAIVSTLIDEFGNYPFNRVC